MLGCAAGDQALLARRKGEYVGGAVLTPFKGLVPATATARPCAVGSFKLDCRAVA